MSPEICHAIVDTINHIQHSHKIKEDFDSIPLYPMEDYDVEPMSIINLTFHCLSSLTVYRRKRRKKRGLNLTTTFNSYSNLLSSKFTYFPCLLKNRYLVLEYCIHGKIRLDTDVVLSCLNTWHHVFLTNVMIKKSCLQ